MITTLFPSVRAQRAEERDLTLAAIAELVRSTLAPTKANLPLLKLARFGDRPTAKGAIRNNDNVLGVTGVEGDYDDGAMSAAEAYKALVVADIAALVYESPSSTPTTPKWRVLCPLSAPCAPADRKRLVARLNAALGGVLAVESFTLSQAFYLGRVEGTPERETWLAEPGRFLDEANEIAEIYPTTQRVQNERVPTRDGFAPGSILPKGEPAEMLAAGIARIEAAEPRTRYDTARGIGWQLAPHVITGSLDREQVRLILVDAAAFAGGKDPELVGRAFDDAIEKLEGAVYIPTYGAEFCALPPEDGEPGRLDRRSLRDRIVRPADCADGPRRGYLIKGLLAPGDVAAVIGQPGCGKSVWAPHVAYAVAQGRRAFGLRTKPGAVLYLAAEDYSGMRQRVAALRGRHGDAPLFGLADIGNLRDDGQSNELAAYVEAETPALIVVDTLGAAWAGMDENGAQDMSAVVALARRMAATGAAVLIIHHVPKSGDATPRGHSVLNGTLDMSVLLERDANSGIVRSRIMKNRNGTPDLDMAFRVDPVVLGQDEDGDQITAPIAAELAGQDRPKAKLSSAAEKALHELRKLGSSSEEAWCAACDPVVSTSTDAENRGRAFRRARAELASKGYVETKDGTFSIAGSELEVDASLAEMMG